MIVLMTSQSLETRWTKQQQQTQANSMPADDGAKLGGTSWGSVGIHLTCTSIPTTSPGYTCCCIGLLSACCGGFETGMESFFFTSHCIESSTVITPNSSLNIMAGIVARLLAFSQAPLVAQVKKATEHIRADGT